MRKTISKKQVRSVVRLGKFFVGYAFVDENAKDDILTINLDQVEAKIFTDQKKAALVAKEIGGKIVNM